MDTSGFSLKAKGVIPRACITSILVLIFALTVSLVYAASPLVYFIGNSVTDTINYTSFENLVKGQGYSDYDWGRHMIPGAPLEWIYNHPADGFQEAPYGYYPQALPNYPFDIVSIQPYDRPVDSDVYYGGLFFDLALQRNTNCQLYVYTCWPRRDWNGWGDNWVGQYTADTSCITSKAFMEAVADGITNNHPGRKRVLVLGHSVVMNALRIKIEAGQVPGYSSIWGLYNDGVHLNGDGSYLVAATTYCTFFKTDPRNLPTTGYSVSSSNVASIIRNTVWETIPGYSYSGYSGVSPSPPSATPTPTPTSSGPPPTPSPADATITYVSYGPTVDGTVDSVWSEASSYSITKVINGTVSSDSDLSGTWKALWDSANLYYLVEVTDDSKRNDSTNAWDDDSVELYIDADNSKLTYYDGQNDYQLVCGWNDTTISLGSSSATNITGVQFDIADTAAGYRLEFSIPWTTMGVTGQVGQHIGTDVHINDDDDNGARDGKKAWFATADNSWSDPSTFGTAELNAGTVSSATPTISATPTNTPTNTPTSTPTPTSSGSGLPFPWQFNDVGSPLIAGSASYSDGELTINGAGADIWGTSDQFAYVHQGISGDNSIVTRVTSQTNTDGWAKAGVMYRETLNADSKFVDLVVTPSNGLALQWRSATAGSCSHTALGSYTFPVYLKLTRSGNSFTAYKSSDGVNWGSSLGSCSVTMLSSVKTGLCVTSHNTGSLCTAEFDNVNVSGSVSPTATPTATPTNTPTATPSSSPGGAGNILRQYWTGISGTSVSDLTGNANYPDNPSGSSNPASFEAPTDWADNYGTRMLGYIHPPTSGTYYFWIASDDSSELWLSTTDQPANKVKIAYVDGWTSSREWNKYTSQASVGISLTGGQRYYIEALQKEGGGGDNLAVSWQVPGGAQEVIPGSYLSPYTPGVATPTVTPTNTPTPTPTSSSGGTGNLLAYDDFNAATGALDNVNSGAGWGAIWWVQNDDASIPGYNIANSSLLSYSNLQKTGNYAIGGDAYQTAGRALDIGTGGPFASYLSSGLIGANGT
ncbi:MAG: sugar-binding protein, partial [Bacillota bacterium]